VRMAEYDLTKTMSPYFDRHLIFPLLEFICGKQIYNNEDVLKCMLESLQKTKMADYAMDVYKRLYDASIPQEYADKRDKTVEELRSVQSSVKSILEIFSDSVLEKLTEKLQVMNATDFIKELSNSYSFDMKMLDELFNYSRVVFDCGNYNHAADALKIVQTLGSDNESRLLRASWGKLSCMILTQNWNDAMDDLVKLKELLDNTTSCNHLHLLQHRTWMLHWSLFVFFNHPKGKDNLIDWFLLNPHHLNAIQTLAPHLLRYLTVSVIINCKRRKNVIKDLVKVIQQETYNYRDPITEFVESLYVNFDFEKAQTKLRVCEEVLANDFFLTACDTGFIQSARYLIFETFCRLHHTISLDMLAQKLNMDTTEAEEWIVELMQVAKLDAKIDSEEQIIIMGNQSISPYQQVFEKTKNQVFNASKHLAILKKKYGIQSDLF